MLLVRIALVAFAERVVGDPEMAVRCIIRWMHLDDPPKVRRSSYERQANATSNQLPVEG